MLVSNYLLTGIFIDRILIISSGQPKARFRDLKKVEIQFLVTAAALNSKKMVKMSDIEEIKSSLYKKFTDITQIVKDIFRIFAKELATKVSLATGPNS